MFVHKTTHRQNRVTNLNLGLSSLARRVGVLLADPLGRLLELFVRPLRQAALVLVLLGFVLCGSSSSGDRQTDQSDGCLFSAVSAVSQRRRSSTASGR